MAGFGSSGSGKKKKNTPQKKPQFDGDSLFKSAINFHIRGDLTNAEKYYREAIRIGFSHESLYSNLGVICKCSERAEEAIYLYKKSIEKNPNNPNAYSNLGNLLRERGNLDQALACTLKSLELKNDNPDAHVNLGGIYKDLGNLDQALASTLKSLELKPDNPTALMNLGGIYKDLGNLDQAIASTLKTLELEHNNLNALINLSVLYNNKGEHTNAKVAIEQAKAMEPLSLNLNVMASQTFQVIYMEESEIDEDRRKFADASRYIQQNPNLRFREDLPINLGLFWLAYHGRNDDEELLQQFWISLANNSDIKKIISMAEHSCKVNSECSPIKIGIITNFWGKNHPVNLHYSGIISHLASTDIKVELIAGHGVTQKEECEIASKYGTKVTRLTQNFGRNCKIITGLNLDLLLYPDIGMSSDTYLLGLARLAPVQAVMAGHPCSTGLNEIDYFISSQLMETEDAQVNYSEQLIRFRKMPTSMKYTNPTDVRKNTIKLDKNKIKIGIIHSLFKLTPEFDDTLEKISEIDDRIELIMFKTHPNLSENLKKRWLKNSQKLLNRIRFIPRLDYHEFIEFIGQLDIVLDPYSFGAGTVFYQCMACGLPVVTKPTNLLKTRVATGGYKQMLLKNPPIASSEEEYVEIIKRLVKSKDLREKLSCEIKERAVTHLFNHNETLMEYEAFVRDSIKFSRRNEKLPKDWRALLHHS